MPKIDDLMNNSKKKFKKSVYRPWNYMDEIEKENQKNVNEIKKVDKIDELINTPLDQKIPSYIKKTI